MSRKIICALAELSFAAFALALVLLAPLEARAVPAGVTPPFQVGQTARGQPPILVSCCSSVSWYGSWDSTVYSTANGGYGAHATSYAISEYAQMMKFCGGCVRQQGYIIANNYSNVDYLGDYGNPGQTIATDLTDMKTNWFPALAAAGIVPNIVNLTSFVENDINAGKTAAQVEAAAETMISTIQAAWPGVVIMMNTPRPDGRNSGSEITVWQQIVAWMPTLDDGKTLFVTNISGTNLYEDPANPGIPLPGYTFLNAITESLTLDNGVHDRQNAASLIGRADAATLQRIVGLVPYPVGSLTSPNLTLTGSVAITTTKVTGTGPTGATIAVPPTGSSSSVVGTASNPGPWNLVFTDTSGTPDFIRVRFGSVLPSPIPAKFGGYWKFQIVSGAANIAQITGGVQISTTGTGCSSEYNFYEPIAAVSNPTVQPQVYQNGDIITILAPPVQAGAGCTVTNLTPDFWVYSQGLGTPISLNALVGGGVISYYTPGATAAITPGTSPYNYQNATTGPLDVIVTGGTVSAISFCRPLSNCIATGQTTGTFRLNPTDYLQVTYSVAPTMTAVPR